AAVSKLENQVAMYVSTLRRFVEAMGGELVISAHFADGAVRINQFENVDDPSRRREAEEPWPSAARTRDGGSQGRRPNRPAPARHRGAAAKTGHIALPVSKTSQRLPRPLADADTISGPFLVGTGNPR